MGALALAGLVAAIVLHGVGNGRPGPSRPAPAADLGGARRARTDSTPHRVPATRGRSPAARALGLGPVPPGPVPGYVLIADRDNGRIIIVSPGKRVVWRFPPPRGLPAAQSFRDPDDAFFTPDYRRVITNEEFNDQIAQIDLRSRRIVWTHGRAGIAGSGPDELSNPDDAYGLRGGAVLVADIRNCRVLRLSPAGRTQRIVGTTGVCVHDPPRALQSPNGDTPLADGGMLITEIGGWVDRLNARGQLVFSVRTPTDYPSDAQLLPNGNVLVAGFNTPGRIDEITPRGRVVWNYAPTSGPGVLDRPSLAVRWPNGMIAATDDWHHRLVVINPRTHRIVWQYGHLGVPGVASGYLNKPDGLALLPAS